MKHWYGLKQTYPHLLYEKWPMRFIFLKLYIYFIIVFLLLLFFFPIAGLNYFSHFFPFFSAFFRQNWHMIAIYMCFFFFSEMPVWSEDTVSPKKQPILKTGVSSVIRQLTRSPGPGEWVSNCNRREQTYCCMIVVCTSEMRNGRPIIQ